MSVKRPLPALQETNKIKNPDFLDIADKNYASTILRYGGLAVKFPQLKTNDKTIVGAINELEAGGGGDVGDHLNRVNPTGEGYLALNAANGIPGVNSVTLGTNALASGLNSFAMGDGAMAKGEGSVSIGGTSSYPTAHGVYASYVYDKQSPSDYYRYSSSIELFTANISRYQYSVCFGPGTYDSVELVFMGPNLDTLTFSPVATSMFGYIYIIDVDNNYRTLRTYVNSWTTDELIIKNNKLALRFVEPIVVPDGCVADTGRRWYTNETYPQAYSVDVKVLNLIPNNNVSGKYSLGVGISNEESGSANLVSGTNNKLDNVSNGFVSGTGNYVSGGALGVIGDNNSVLASYESFTVGYHNDVRSSSYAAIFGTSNRISTSGRSLVAGEVNVSTGSVDSMLIGQANQVDRSPWSVVAGRDNYSHISEYAVMFGEHNAMYYSHNSITQGDNNRLYYGSYGNLAVGTSLKSYGPYNGLIGSSLRALGSNIAIFGADNRAAGSFNIVGGVSNVSDNQNSSVVGSQLFVFGDNSSANGRCNYINAPYSAVSGYHQVALGDGAHAEGADILAGISVVPGVHTEYPPARLADIVSVSGEGNLPSGTYAEIGVEGGSGYIAPRSKIWMTTIEDSNHNSRYFTSYTTNTEPISLVGQDIVRIPVSFRSTEPFTGYIVVLDIEDNTALNIASGVGSHSEGFGNHVSGLASHAEGAFNIVSGDTSHAEGGTRIEEQRDIPYHIIGIEGSFSRISNPSETVDMVWEPDSNGVFHPIDDCNKFYASRVHLRVANIETPGALLYVEFTGWESTLHVGNTPDPESYSQSVTLRIDNVFTRFGATPLNPNISVGLRRNTTLDGNKYQFLVNFPYESRAGVIYYGIGNVASGKNSHVEGVGNKATGNYSHAEGYYTEANGDYQHVSGVHNLAESDKLLIVGNGLDGTPSNAHTIDTDGTAWFSGDVYVGSASGTHKDEGSVALLKQGDEIPYKQDTLISGTNIKTINGISLLGSGNIPISGGGGGSTVVVNPIVTSGTEIARIAVDGEPTSIYAPTVDVPEITVTPTLTSGTKIATISVDGTSKDLYAPNGGDTVEMVDNPSGGVSLTVDGTTRTLAEQSSLSNLQPTLVSGENIKTINGQTILGNGDIHIEGGSTDITMSDNTDGGVDLTVDTLTRTLATESDLKTKQDILIAGTNIVIGEDGKTISSTGGSGKIDYVEGLPPEPVTRAAAVHEYIFQINELRSPNPSSHVMQMAELELFDFNSVPIVDIRNLQSSAGEISQGERIALLIDGSIYTKYVTSQTWELPIQISFTSPYDIKYYRWCTGNDAADRDPISWTLFKDGKVISDVETANVPTDRRTWTILYTTDTITPGLTGINVTLQDISGNNLFPYIPMDSVLSADGALPDVLNAKQDALVSGENIKTINGESILGEGDIVIHGGGSTVEVNPILTTGTEIATISVDGESKTLYAPNGGDVFDYDSAVKTTEVDGFTTTSQTVQGAVNEINAELDSKADSSALNDKQDTLVSGTNIKTINGISLLGEGNIDVQGGGSGDVTKAYLEEHYYDKEFFGDISTLEVVDDTPTIHLMTESDMVNYATKAYVDSLIGELDSLIGSGVIR